MSARKNDSEKKANRLTRKKGPRLAKDEFRMRYPIRLNAQEQALIADAARKVGLPPSTWVRMVALESANRIIAGS